MTAQIIPPDGVVRQLLSMSLLYRTESCAQGDVGRGDSEADGIK